MVTTAPTDTTHSAALFFTRLSWLILVLALLVAQSVAVPITLPPVRVYGEESVFHHPLHDGTPGPVMIRIPPGCFTMGLAPAHAAGSDEETARPVTCVGEFALGRDEVTFDEYDRFVQATKRTAPNDAGFGRGQHPVINVTWDDARSYAAWLAEQTGETYRLPTETEWEYAARAGTNHPWAWGDGVGVGQAVCRRCGSRWDFRSTAPVGSFPPNSWGLNDMGGNVWQWTCSPFVAQPLFWGLVYDARPPREEGNQCADPSAFSAWVMRGGSWFNLPEQLRTTYRTGQSADYSYRTLGFRVAWSDTRSPRMTHLTLIVTPPDARILLLNPERLGNTTMDLPMGRYHLRIEKPGFVSLDQWVVLAQPAQELRISIRPPESSTTQTLDVPTLEQNTVPPLPEWQPEPPTAHLMVRTDPSNAHVVLLDPERPYTPEMALAPGYYHLRVQAPGYESVEKTIEHKQEDTTITVSLPWIEPTTGMVFLTVPEGSFPMGSAPQESQRNTDEEPQHTVHLTSFLLGKYPVTFEQWHVCVADHGCRYQPNDQGWGQGNRPVINVSWFDATAFAEWLSHKTARQYRLPTEEEWEYATRAGTTTPYWWGNEMERGRSNCDGCGSPWDNMSTSPVGSFPPNPWGFFDLPGNVWEWMCTAYAMSYNGSEARCVAKDSRNLRGLRGGSWYNLPHAMRSANRYRDAPGSRNSYIGFRLVGVLP